MILTIFVVIGLEPKSVSIKRQRFIKVLNTEGHHTDLILHKPIIAHFLSKTLVLLLDKLHWQPVVDQLLIPIHFQWSQPDVLLTTQQAFFGGGVELRIPE